MAFSVNETFVICRLYYLIAHLFGDSNIVLSVVHLMNLSVLYLTLPFCYNYNTDNFKNIFINTRFLLRSIWLWVIKGIRLLNNILMNGLI
jgi:hypothetical protein